MPATQAQTAVFQYYLAKGVNPIAAAGITGVLNYESKLNPLAENNSGTDTGGALNQQGAFGLAQWNGPRQQALQDFATKKGTDPKLIQTQLDFVLTECANSYPEVWTAIQSPTDLTSFIATFVKTYEVPANPAPEIAGALGVAQALLASPAPAPVPTPAPVPDPELQTLEQIWSLLTPLSTTARSRIIAYLQSRANS